MLIHRVLFYGLAAHRRISLGRSSFSAGLNALKKYLGAGVITLLLVTLSTPHIDPTI
ncbi:hypothetical protein DSUL_30021 [Desulfovibrionales bacterium]